MSTFLIVAFTVPPIRIAIINFYIEKHEEYYEFRKQDSDETNPQEPKDNTTEINDIVPYIPEGFIIKDVISNGLNINIIFDNGTDIIRFERTVGEGSTYVDSENVEYDVLHIEGVDIHIFTKNGMYTLIFSKSQYSYLISSEFDIDELIKLADEVIKK